MKSTTCRSCGSSELALVHDFGPQPLAGEYPSTAESERSARRYRLDLTQCHICGLLQVTNLPPIEEVFHDDYRYSSSTVPDLVRHFEAYADHLAERLPSGARILEFGCNDGVLLARLRDRGFVVTGVDASHNMAEIARSKGLDVRTGFFTADFALANHLSGSFDAVTCSNVFAHIDDLQGAMAAVRTVLKPGGLFFVEVHDAEVLLREAQFDTVYHEHLTYFGTDTLTGLAVRNGFSFVSCDAIPMHGGGLRFCGRFEPDMARAAPPFGVAADGAVFSQAIARCRETLGELAERYGPLYGYGAAGRAQMFINMTESAGLFEAVYDDSPFRQHRYIVGTDIPIVPYASQNGGCCVILAWNYAETIAAKLDGRFERIVALFPEFRDLAPQRARDNR